MKHFFRYPGVFAGIMFLFSGVAATAADSAAYKLPDPVIPEKTQYSAAVFQCSW